MTSTTRVGKTKVMAPLLMAGWSFPGMLSLLSASIWKRIRLSVIKK